MVLLPLLLLLVDLCSKKAGAGEEGEVLEEVDLLEPRVGGGGEVVGEGEGDHPLVRPNRNRLPLHHVREWGLERGLTILVKYLKLFTN